MLSSNISLDDQGQLSKAIAELHDLEVVFVVTRSRDGVVKMSMSYDGDQEHVAMKLKDKIRKAVHGCFPGCMWGNVQ